LEEEHQRKNDFVIVRQNCAKDVDRFLQFELELQKQLQLQQQEEEGVRGGGDLKNDNTTTGSTVLPILSHPSNNSNNNNNNSIVVVIVSFGIWEAVRPWDCRENEHDHDLLTLNNNDHQQEDTTRNRTTILLSVLERCNQLQRLNPNMIILWRTSGFVDDDSTNYNNNNNNNNNDYHHSGQVKLSKANMIVQEMNNFVMDYIDQRNQQLLLSSLLLTQQEQNQTTSSSALGRFIQKNNNNCHHTTTTNNYLTYVDWGGAIQSRSFGKERIQGDLKPHYGLEPRLVLIQMITNRLKEYLL